MKIAILILFIGACMARPAIMPQIGPFRDIGAIGEVLGWDNGQDESGRYTEYVEYRQDEDKIYTYIAFVDPETNGIVDVILYVRKENESLAQAEQQIPILKENWNVPLLSENKNLSEKEDALEMEDIPEENEEDYLKSEETDLEKELHQLEAALKERFSQKED